MSNASSLPTKAIHRLPRVMPVLEQEHRIMAVAKERNWPFRVLGVAPVPTEPVYFNSWWLVPALEDHSPIPARALERIQTIYAEGIRPKAVMIAHEAPPLLAPPANMPRPSVWQVWAPRLAKYSLTSLKVIAATLSVAGFLLTRIVAPVLGLTVGIGLLGLFTVITAIAIDPALIVITEDNVWIQIDSWLTE